MEFSSPVETWNKRYAASQVPLFGEQPNVWLRQCLQHCAHWIKPAGRALCIAEGQGRNAIHLARLDHDVTAFDVSPVAIAHLSRAASDENVTVDAQVCDLNDWQWEADSFDTIVAIFVQFASPMMRDAMFAGIARALRPGGVLIIEGYGPRQLNFRTGGPRALENLYTMALLTGGFADWQTLASRDVDVQLAEGTGHAGRSHVVSAALRRPDGLDRQRATR